MAQDGDFTLISVTPDDEDEVVIQAGALTSDRGESLDDAQGRADAEEGPLDQADDEPAEEIADEEIADGEGEPGEDAPAVQEDAEPANAESENAGSEDAEPENAEPENVESEETEAAAVLDAETLRVKRHLEDAGLSVEDLDEEARSEYERHMARSHARAQAEQMLTTEDDLHTKMPFSGMQRAIVLLLLVLVVAFVLYWMVGR